MSLWRGAEPLVLASKSAARRAVLEAAGIPLKIAPVDLDERKVEAEAAAAGAGPDDVARLLARAKAVAGSRMVGSGAYVVGADQTLALDGLVFHKAPDRDAAVAQIARLSGRTHALHSAVAVVRGEEVLFERLETACLTMRTLSDTAVEAYLDAAGPAIFGSVGCYQLEALGVHLFETIEGDHFTILGLPLLPLLGFLRGEGLIL